MKKYSRALIGTAAAIITFGSLVAFVGVKHHKGEHYKNQKNCERSCHQQSTENK